jgi:hypothetical protein
MTRFFRANRPRSVPPARPRGVGPAPLVGERFELVLFLFLETREDLREFVHHEPSVVDFHSNSRVVYHALDQSFRFVNAETGFDNNIGYGQPSLALIRELEYLGFDVAATPVEASVRIVKSVLLVERVRPPPVERSEYPAARSEHEEEEK